MDRYEEALERAKKGLPIDLSDFVNNPNNFNTIYWNYFGLA